MLRRVAFALAVFVSCAGAAPGDRTIASLEDGVTLTVPAGSPVTFTEQLEDIYTFTGDFTISGTFTFGFVYSEPAGGIVQHFVFVPDAASVKSLPHWTEDIGQIGFANDDAFLKAAVPAATLAALKARQTGSVSGHVTVHANQWNTSYVCDTAYYTLQFTGLAAPARMIAAKPLSDPGDC